MPVAEPPTQITPDPGAPTTVRCTAPARGEPATVTVGWSTPLSSAVRLMRYSGQALALVVDDRAPVAVVALRDLDDARDRADGDGTVADAVVVPLGAPRRPVGGPSRPVHR